jgi:CubicO group peptidase (beta-lactamase class C family)
MKRLSIVLALVLSFVTAAPLRASELPTAKPEQVGLSSERLGRITQVLRADVERGRIPGAVVVVARKGRVAYVQAVGFRDKTAGAPMTPDAIFRIASMTKPIVTVAALSLWEEGRLSLSDPVSKYIPELKNQTVGMERAPVEREMTIQDLMRHTSGLTYGNRGTTEIYKMYPESSSVSSLTLTMDELIERLSKAPLLNQAGTRWEYSLSTDVLARVVEIVSGKPLGDFLAERIYRPLKMTDTMFLVSADNARVWRNRCPRIPTRARSTSCTIPRSRGSSTAAGAAPSPRPATTRASPRCS